MERNDHGDQRLRHMRRTRLPLLQLLLFCICLATACKKTAPPVNQSSQSGQSGRANQAAQPVSRSNSGANIVDQGDLKLVYHPRKSVNKENTVGSDPEVLAQIISNLNDKLALPWDLPVSFEECGEPDAHYDPEIRQLTICYELIDEYYDLFADRIHEKEKLDSAVRGALASTFFHELGHGLIDAWQLPITGREEDAVDQLSTLVLINNTNNGEQMALNGAISFKLYADFDKGQPKIYWDEHSLDEQRFYDTICLIYGHAPLKYSYLVKDGTLPEERAEICREDYAKVSRSWLQLLSPFLKQRPGAAPSGSP